MSQDNCCGMVFLPLQARFQGQSSHSSTLCLSLNPNPNPNPKPNPNPNPNPAWRSAKLRTLACAPLEKVVSGQLFWQGFLSLQAPLQGQASHSFLRCLSSNPNPNPNSNPNPAWRSARLKTPVYAPLEKGVSGQLLWHGFPSLAGPFAGPGQPQLSALPLSQP